MIVVIGLGNLGLAFASRLHQSVGHTVGVDPDGSARAAFEADGGATASSLADLDWSDVDTVFVVVRTVAQALTVVDEIGTRRAGYADATATRVFVVTTMDPESAGQLTSRPGIRVMESPISGGSDGTLAGSLTVLLGGPVEADDVTFLESTVAGTVVRFTELGHATLAKLINNAVMAANASSSPTPLKWHASKGSTWLPSTPSSRFPRVVAVPPRSSSTWTPRCWKRTLGYCSRPVRGPNGLLFGPNSSGMPKRSARTSMAPGRASRLTSDSRSSMTC